MNRCARNLRFWWLAPFGFIVVPLRPEPFCVRVPWSAATTPYWSVSWLPDGSLVAGTNQLVEFADDERRAEPAPGLSALRVLLPVSGTRLLAAGVGDATLFDRSTGVWRHDTGRALQKPASGIIDARISDDGASVVLAAIGSVQYVHGNRASEWAVPTLSRICLGRVSGRLAVCHPPYAVLGMTPRGPVERPDLAWADGAAMLLSAGGRIVGIFQGRIGVFHPDGTFLWEPSEAEKMLAEWVIDAGGDDRVLWIATNKGGIRWYDPATGGKIAEAHVSRELSGRICAVNQHPDGRLAVATESCLYVVYPPSVSSAPLPPGHFLFLRSCNGGAVAATSEGHISIGSEVPPLGDAALAFAEWQGREVIGAIGAVSVGGIPCRIDGRAVVDLIPAGDRLLILQAGRAVLINRDLTVSAQTALPEVPNGAADTGGGFLIGTLSGALLRWRPPEPLTVVRSSDPLPHPVRIKSVRGAVWRLAGRSAFRDDDRVPLPEGTFPVDVSGDSAGAWLLCSDAAEGANLWSVPDKGPPILMDAPGIAALRQPQGLLVMPSGRFAIADSSRVLLVDRAVVRPIAAALPGPAAAFAIGPPGERALSLAGPVLGLSAAEDSLVLRWSGEIRCRPGRSAGASCPMAPGSREGRSVSRRRGCRGVPGRSPSIFGAGVGRGRTCSPMSASIPGFFVLGASAFLPRCSSGSLRRRLASAPAASPGAPAGSKSLSPNARRPLRGPTRPRRSSLPAWATRFATRSTASWESVPCWTRRPCLRGNNCSRAPFGMFGTAPLPP